MEEINISEFFKYYFSKMIIIVIVVLATVSIGNIYSFLMRKPLYESNTTIVLAGNSKNNTGEYTSTDSQLNQRLVSTYSEIIKSRKVLQQVIDDEQLDYSVGELSKEITVSSVEDTEIIKISVSDEDSLNARKIANDIVPVFSDEVKRIYNIDNVSVVDEAVEAKAPYNINYIKENLIYILIGVILASTIIFIIYYFDTTIKSSEDVEEKLGLTVIGIVPSEERE